MSCHFLFLGFPLLLLEILKKKRKEKKKEMSSRIKAIKTDNLGSEEKRVLELYTTNFEIAGANLSADDKAKILQLFEVNLMHDTEVKEFCIQLRPYMAQVFDIWASSPMKSILASIAVLLRIAKVLPLHKKGQVREYFPRRIGNERALVEYRHIRSESDACHRIGFTYYGHGTNMDNLFIPFPFIEF